MSLPLHSTYFGGNVWSCQSQIFLPGQVSGTRSILEEVVDVRTTHTYQFVDLFLKAIELDEEWNGVVRLVRLLANEVDDVNAVLAAALNDDNMYTRLFAGACILDRAAGARDGSRQSRLFTTAERIFVEALRLEEEAHIWACLLLGVCSAEVPGPTEPLIQALFDSPFAPTKMMAACALSKTVQDNADVMRTLCDGLSDDNRVVLCAVALAIARIDGKKAVPRLTELISRPTSEHRYAGLIALRELGGLGSDAVDTVSEMLNDETSSLVIRACAASALGYISQGKKAGNVQLLEALHSEIPDLVEGAIDGFIGKDWFPDDVVRRLGDLLQLEHADLRAAALVAIAKAGHRGRHALSAILNRMGSESDPRMVYWLAKAVAAIGESTLPMLIDIVRQRDFAKIANVGLAFHLIGAASIVAILDVLREDANPDVMGFLVAVLRDMGEAATDAVPAMAVLLDSTNDESLVLCLLMAIHITGAGAAQAAPSIVRRLVHGSEQAAHWAELALINIGLQAVPILDAAFVAGSDAQKNRVARVLARLLNRDDVRFRQFEEIGDDDLLMRFLWVGTILKQGPTSWRKMEKILSARERAGKIPPDASISASKLRNTLEQLEERWGITVTTRIPGRKGGLTDAGAERLRQVEEYLRIKVAWRGQNYDGTD